MVSGLTFKSLIIFCFFFFVWCKIRVQFHFFACGCPFFLNTTYLQFYFWLHWVFVAVSGAASLVAVWLLLVVAFLVEHGLWGILGFSSCGSRAPARRLSSCGSRAYLFCGMWDLPRSGIKPLSPALAGRFVTTEPPGKSLNTTY